MTKKNLLSLLCLLSVCVLNAQDYHLHTHRNGNVTYHLSGTTSDGTNFHNYYTGATYTGGSSKTVTVNTTPITMMAY